MRCLLIFLNVVVLFSCNKENEGDTYIVNASKMIGITGNDYNNVESQLKRKNGYKYTVANASSGIKAEVRVSAIDDSNRVVHGEILLNISLDNKVQFGMFNTEPIAQTAAYAMMLNYNNGTLQSISGITFSIGEVIENGAGSNTPVSTVLSKLTNGQIADQLGISYTAAQGRFTMVIFRQSDGRYIFSYRGTK